MKISEYCPKRGAAHHAIFVAAFLFLFFARGHAQPVTELPPSKQGDYIARDFRFKSGECCPK